MLIKQLIIIFYLCLNSIKILERQISATKLKSCYCDGTENFDCVGIKTNMEELCFKETNEIDIDTKNSKAYKCRFSVMLFFVTFVIANL